MQTPEQKHREIKTEEGRLKKDWIKLNRLLLLPELETLKEAVSYGSIFPCCSCEQMMFEKWKNGSLILDGRLKEEIKVKCDSNDGNLFNKVFGKTIK